MTEEPSPSLADDEAMLAHYARQLADLLGERIQPWMAGLVLERAPELAEDAVIAGRVSAAAAAVADEVTALLARDIAEQPTGPLEVLRRAVGVPNEILREANVPAPPRDEFAVANFPNDLYDLSPASFAAIDPSLHEPGLLWGAAKAHVHLRRRREE